MKKCIIIILIVLFVGSAYAYRTARPINFTDLTDPAQINQLNTILTELWDLTNGRYHMNETTTNPDGTRNGYLGEMILFNDSGTYYLCINVNGVKIWKSTLLQDLP